MKNLSWLFVAGLVSGGLVPGCGVDPAGLLGKCDQDVPGVISFPGQKYCSDYSFETSSSKDLKSAALAEAKSSCGSGTWTDGEACSTTLGTATGYCKFSIGKTSGSESYTLKYRAVFGPAFIAGASAIQSWCVALNVAPLSASWSTSP